MSHGGLKRARSWKRRIQPKEAYSSPGLLYSEACANGLLATVEPRVTYPNGRLFCLVTRSPN